VRGALDTIDRPAKSPNLADVLAVIQLCLCANRGCVIPNRSKYARRSCAMPTSQSRGRTSRKIGAVKNQGDEPSIFVLTGSLLG
jgi:hypothetical protein